MIYAFKYLKYGNKCSLGFNHHHVSKYLSAYWIWNSYLGTRLVRFQYFKFMY